MLFWPHQLWQDFMLLLVILLALEQAAFKLCEIPMASLDLTTVLEKFVGKAERLLLDHDRIAEIQYDISGAMNFVETMKASKNSNNKVLAELLRDSANIYAIWGRRDAMSGWKLYYIGQRKSHNIRQRLIEHLFYKHDRTGSKLEAVRGLVREGFQVGISVVHVLPDEVRSAVEELLIRANRPEWNIHGSLSE